MVSMSIYFLLFNVVLSLVLTAINIMEFFLLVRAVMMFKEVTWLSAFDTAGKDLVVSITTRVDSLFYQVRNRHLSERWRIIAGAVVLELLKALAGGVC